jgi:hypothetical protein
MSSCYDHNGYPESQRYHSLPFPFLTFFRNPIDLCFALDVSESMSKQFPGYGFTLLEMALRQIFFTLKKLTSHDRIGLILFCSEEREVFPLAPCTESNKTIFMRLLSSITCKKSTWSCLGRGLAAALCSITSSSTSPPMEQISTNGPQHHRCKRVVYLSNFDFPNPSNITANENQLLTLISNALYGHITPPLSVPSLHQRFHGNHGGVIPRITKKTYSPQNAIYISVVSVGNGMLSMNCRQEICQIIGAKYYSFQNELILENLISHEMVPVASNISLTFPSNVSITKIYGSSEFTSFNPIYTGDSTSHDVLNEITISSEFPSPTPNILLISLRLLKSSESENKRKAPEANGSQDTSGRKRLRFEEDEPVAVLPRFHKIDEGDGEEGDGQDTDSRMLPLPLRVEWRDRNGILHTHTIPLTISSSPSAHSSRHLLRHYPDLCFGLGKGLSGHDHTTSPSSSSSQDDLDHSSICPPAISSSPLSLPPAGISSPKITPISEVYLLIDFVDCVQYYIQCISTDLMNKLLHNDFSETTGEMFIPDTVILSLRHLKRSGSLYSIPSLHVTGLMPTAQGSSLSDSLLFYHIILMKLICCQRSLAESLLTSPPSQDLLQSVTQLSSSSGVTPIMLSFQSPSLSTSSSSCPTSSSPPSGYRYLYETLHQIISLEKIEYEKCLSQLMTSSERKQFDELCPKQYLCPISLTIMKHPVIAHDGYSYEEEHILKWFRTGNITSPVTNSMIPSTQVIVNYTLKGLIDEFMEKFHDTYLDTTTAANTTAQQQQAETNSAQHLLQPTPHSKSSPPSNVHAIITGQQSSREEDSALTPPFVISSVPISEIFPSTEPK